MSNLVLRIKCNKVVDRLPFIKTLARFGLKNLSSSRYLTYRGMIYFRLDFKDNSVTIHPSYNLPPNTKEDLGHVPDFEELQQLINMTRLKE